MSARPTRRVALITLGCSRNEVDSEELAARLGAGGWQLVEDAADADAVLVNTCGFVDAAKKDSIDALLAADGLRAEDGPQAVVAVGCLAERYGRDLAASLPEADAVLGFDAYPAISSHLDAVLSGATPPVHAPRDRRTLLPITPVDRATAAAGSVHLPGHAQDVPLRRRLTEGPVAALKISSGCDRRCAFCAIPSFRGSHVSRPPEDLLAEAAWLAEAGARELVLVSENSTSYGKDLGDLRALEKLLPQLAATDGIVRVRTVYLQPAELRPSLLETLLTTPGVAPYLDLSFQHASPSVLRRMRRFGGAADFRGLLRRARAIEPELGARSNVIVGFPGETREDVETLVQFLSDADLDAVGVFGYSDEEGTEAASMTGKVSAATVERRRARLTDLVEALTAARAELRVGATVEVLVEDVTDGVAHGCAGHQQPEVDGACAVRLPAGGTVGEGGAVGDGGAVAEGGVGGPPAAGRSAAGDTAGMAAPPVRVGDLIRARVVAAEGVDLVAEFVGMLDRAPARSGAAAQRAALPATAALTPAGPSGRP